MQNLAISRERLKRSNNKGFLEMESVNIYSDVKGGCPCGGKFSARQNFPAETPGQFYEIPICEKCSAYPKFFYISAYGLDVDGHRTRFRIRHSQDQKRLTNFYDCIYVLRRVKEELESGEFDARKYDSKASRESYLFENHLAEYERNCEERLQGKKQPFLSPNGFRHKKRMWKHLLRHFEGVDIASIRKLHLERFKKNFEGSEDTLRKCLSELKTILMDAAKEEKVHRVPDFGKIGKSRERETTMTLEEGMRIIEHIKNPTYRDMLTLLTIYPVRPCEIPVLKWRNVNLFSKEITFETHISHKQEIDGRKSRRKGDKYASLTLPLTSLAEDIFKRQVRDLNQDAYVFKGIVNDFVSLGTLSDAWVEARKLAGAVPNERTRYQKYELKHALLSEMNKKVNGNLKLLEKASGVDYQTLIRKYVRVQDDDVKTLFS